MTKIYDSKVKDRDWRKLEFVAPITVAAVQEGVQEESSDFFEINGVAINATTTRNGNTYTVHELRRAAPSLKGQPILKDHINSVDNIVGRTTGATYNEQSQRIDFTGRILDESIKQKIKDGRINSVSVGASVEDVEEIFDDEGNMTSAILHGLEFMEISVVAIPADPNAGFAAAVAESLDLKHSSMKDATEKESNDNLEDIQMTEKKEEVVQETEQKDSAIMDALNKLSENLSALSKKVEELETPEPEEEPEQVEEPVAEVEDETEGAVATVTEEEVSNDSLVVDRHSKEMYFESYEDLGYSTLTRGKI